MDKDVKVLVEKIIKHIENHDNEEGELNKALEEFLKGHSYEYSYIIYDEPEGKIMSILWGFS